MMQYIDTHCHIHCIDYPVDGAEIVQNAAQAGVGKIITMGCDVADSERCRELIDAADEMTRRLYCVVDWLALHPEYNPKTKVIPKKDYPVLVDVTF